MNADDVSLSNASRRSITGLLYAGGAFLIWGLSPGYWKALLGVPALEIIAHRTIWSCVFLFLLSLAPGRWVEFKAVLRTPRSLVILFVTAILVGGNWLTYVWAVNAGHLLQASLGYYINPLVNVMLGMVFLRERLSRNQKAAVLLAVAAVVYRTVALGQLPWIPMTLGFGFGIYGLIRKVVPVPSLAGVAVETLLLTPFAAAYLVYLKLSGGAVFFREGAFMDFLLAGTGVVTAVPLLFFNLAARRVDLSTLGLMQFIAPSCMFLLAVLAYGEPFTADQLWTFVMIWVALAIYSVDSLRARRRPSPGCFSRSGPTA
jgi:chloramphenicol-sensitive protein RarD